MTFDEWMTAQNPKYRSADDGESLRLARACWDASKTAENERIAQWYENSSLPPGSGKVMADFIRDL